MRFLLCVRVSAAWCSRFLITLWFPVSPLLPQSVVWNFASILSTLHLFLHAFSQCNVWFKSQLILSDLFATSFSLQIDCMYSPTLIRSLKMCWVVPREGQTHAKPCFVCSLIWEWTRHLQVTCPKQPYNSVLPILWYEHVMLNKCQKPG